VGTRRIRINGQNIYPQPLGWCEGPLVVLASGPAVRVIHLCREENPALNRVDTVGENATEKEGGSTEKEKKNGFL